MLTKGITRRDFLKGFAACGISLAALGSLPAFADESSEAKAQEEENIEIVKHYDCDVVVAGSGGCGCAAATRAAQLGMKTILVEQSGFTGGTSMCTEGLFAVGTHLQDEAGVDLTVEDCFALSMDYNHWEGDGKLAMEFFRASKDNFDWLESLGIKFMGVWKNGDSLQCWHVYEEDDSGVPGNLYMQTFANCAKEQGAEIHVSTSAQKLVMKDGRVAGLICRTDEGYVQYDAPVVILATGGYANNADMIRKFANVNPDRVVPAGVGQRNGEGIQMALDNGAALCSYPGAMMFYGGQVEGAGFGTTPIFAITGAQPILFMNDRGERFVGEEVSAVNFSYNGNAIRAQKRAFCVLNKTLIDRFENEGVYSTVGAYYAANEPIPGLWDAVNDQLENNSEYVKKADTIEELAEIVGASAEAVKTTLDNYNAYCAAGKDLEFNKPAQWLIPVEGGPYYVFDMKVGFFTTVGGLKVNEKNEVLNEDFEPIPGLYAGGSEAGGLYGASYDVVICAGSQQGWAVHSGKRSAESAKAYLESL